MAKKDHNTLLSEKRTHLSEKRTEMSLERTLMSYLRTATTLILFGIAFIGFSKIRWDFLYFAGIFSITGGVLFFILAAERFTKHYHEVKKIKHFFSNLKYEFRK